MSSATISRSRGVSAPLLLTLGGIGAPLVKPIRPYEGRRQIEQNRLRANRRIKICAGVARNWRLESVRELDEHARRPHQGEGVGDELRPPGRRLVEQRQAGDDGGDRLAGEWRQRARKVIGVALDDADVVEAAFQHTTKSLVVLDEHQSFRRQTGVDQRPGDGTRAGPELNDEAMRWGARRRRHCARESPAGRRNGASQPWRGDERFEKTRAVPEPSPTCLVQRLTPHFSSKRRASAPLRVYIRQLPGWQRRAWPRHCSVRCGPRRTLSSWRRSQRFPDGSCSTIRKQTPP